jgi:hypothetical protein
MNARAPHAVAVGFAFALLAGPSAADNEPDAATTKVIVVDVESLPLSELPAVPAESDAPAGAPAWTETAAIAVTPAGEFSPSRRPRKPSPSVSKKSIIVSERTKTVKLVQVAPASPSLDAIYAPSSDATHLEGQASQRLSCGERASILPMRWEALATTADGDARLTVHDLWFDAMACAVGPGPITTIPLKAIAWDGDKPWLYAMRSHNGVTLVMPRVNEVSSESMVGTPVAMRGAFTRISMPLGRWGSGSIVAQLDSLAGAPAGDGTDRPVEVGIELVQTMSEKAPTLLVRTRQASVASEGEGRD